MHRESTSNASRGAGRVSIWLGHVLGGISEPNLALAPRTPMLALLTGGTSLVAHSPLTVTRSAVSFQHSAAPVTRADAPEMILSPVVRGAVIGGAAVGLVKTFLEGQPKKYTTG